MININYLITLHCLHDSSVDDQKLKSIVNYLENRTHYSVTRIYTLFDKYTSPCYVNVNSTQ